MQLESIAVLGDDTDAIRQPVAYEHQRVVVFVNCVLRLERAVAPNR